MDEPLPLYNDAPTPMIEQYLKIKGEHQDAILFFRLGDFYEMFFDDAVEASEILDITLTTRNKNDPNPVPLCGVPYHSVEPYISKLIDRGKRVAICEQVEDPKLAKGVVRREVVRIVTPGTLLSDEHLEAKEHNFLAAIFAENNRFGIAVADVSTGFFQAGELASFSECCETLVRYEPREILLPEGRTEDFQIQLTKIVPKALTSFVPLHTFRRDQTRFLSASDDVPVIFEPLALAAAGALLSYLEETQKGKLPHMTRLERLGEQWSMRLDAATKRNLELLRTIHEGGREGSLLWLLDRTKTAMGGRLLKNWILAPLIDCMRIEQRLNVVQELSRSPHLCLLLNETLREIYDLERIAGRVAMGTAHARDVVALGRSLEGIAKLRSLLQSMGGESFASLRDALDDLTDIQQTIASTLVDDPPPTLRDGGMIRQGLSPELDELVSIAHHGKDVIAGIEVREREATGIGSLKVRYNKVFGYFLEVTNTHRDKVPAHYIRKQTLVGSERYITPELKEYEEKVLLALERSQTLEQQMFVKLREEIAVHVGRIMGASRIVAELDVLVSFAEVAVDLGYIRPEMVGEDSLLIEEGRHPIVEQLSKEERFVPNDVRLGGDHGRFVMITGPNMAGKSTVMRQTALIVLMAQIGSFVPAKRARIGVVDRIFTRVGASDAIGLGQSTFMVEMSEAAVILSQATRQSLVIIDEIGRGTSTFDGLAIAWAVAEDLHDRVGARTLFATHYHELADIASTKSNVRNYQIAVTESAGRVIFLRRLIPGSTSHSYGLHVAEMAGLPALVIERAKAVLSHLEQRALARVSPDRVRSPA